jgi:nitrile hydratase
MRPEGTDGWSADELARLATRDSMIGTAVALNPDGARG